MARRMKLGHTSSVILLVVAALAALVTYLSGQPAEAPAPLPDAPAASSSSLPASLGSPTALKRLTVADPSSRARYSRERDFGRGWADLDHDGCNTREEVLARDLSGVRLGQDQCNVEAGTLRDPYSGRTIDFNEDANASSVQIDHIYPLSLAWQHGAESWTPARRLAFANDPRNLLAVDGPTNASKGDSGPGEWMPVTRAYACTYARKFTAIAYAYRLSVTAADKDALALALNTCPSSR